MDASELEFSVDSVLSEMSEIRPVPAFYIFKDHAFGRAGEHASVLFHVKV